MSLCSTTAFCYGVLNHLQIGVSISLEEVIEDIPCSHEHIPEAFSETV